MGMRVWADRRVLHASPLVHGVRWSRRTSSHCAGRKWVRNLAHCRLWRNWAGTFAAALSTVSSCKISTTRRIWPRGSPLKCVHKCLIGPTRLFREPFRCIVFLQVFKFADKTGLYFNCQIQLTIKDKQYGCSTAVGSLSGDFVLLLMSTIVWLFENYLKWHKYHNRKWHSQNSADYIT